MTQYNFTVDYGLTLNNANITATTANNPGAINWAGNSSGDGNGYTTMQLVPDETLTGTDQYLIIDPTGGSPGHIHIRAGGTQDNSSADLFLGGENSYVKLPAGLDPNVQIAANTHVWTFGSAGAYGELTLPAGEGAIRTNDDTLSLVSFNTTTGNANSVYLGSSGGLGFSDQEIGGNWLEIFRSGAEPEIRVPVGRGNLNLQTAEGIDTYNWTFDNTGNLNLPGNIISNNDIIIDNRAGGNTADIQLYSADDILIQGRDRVAGASADEGGDVSIFAGDGRPDNGTQNAGSGGDLDLYAGDGGQGGTVDFGGIGGFVNLRSGDGGTANALANSRAGAGGDVFIFAGNAGGNDGNASLGDNGGDVEIRAGIATGFARPGGNIIIATGEGGQNASAGQLQITVPASDTGSGGTWTFAGNALLQAPGAISATGNITAANFFGNVANLTNSGNTLSMGANGVLSLSDTSQTYLFLDAFGIRANTQMQLSAENFATGNNSTIQFDKNGGGITLKLETNAPSQAIWAFYPGNVTFPDSSVQTSAYTGTSPIAWVTAPVANTSPGTPGQAAYDTGGNLYVCVNANTWSKFTGTTSW